jgi:hypothetical protein
MANRITVITQPRNRITINTPQRTQVKTVNVVGATDTGSGIDTLEELKDVNAGAKANNNTLVYDAASQTYIVKELPVINGGTF